MSRRPQLARILALLFLPLALPAAACGVSTVGRGNSPTPTPTATPQPATCAQVQGFAAATPINIPNTQFPDNTVATTPTKTAGGGAGQFTITEFDGCAPNNTPDLIVNSGKGPKPLAALLPFYGWDPSSPSFPTDGQLLTACPANQCFDYSSQHTRYLSVSNATQLANKLVTFHVRLAAPPPAPSCGPNFTGSPLHGYQTTGQNGMPLPPLTLAAPDDASGGLRGLDLCSAGTVASITAFLNSALPATGWAHGADSRCFFTAQCWTKGGNAISWSVTSATDWMTAYRQPIA